MNHPMTTPTRDEAVRQQFEAWASDLGFNLHRDEQSYKSNGSQSAWLAYQAALRSPAVAGLVDACKPLEELWVNDCDMDEPIQRVVAALAQYATIAGESR